MLGAFGAAASAGRGSYLGDRRSFQREVARPVRAALSADGDGKATVEGLRELEKLHRQVGRQNVLVPCSAFCVLLVQPGRWLFSVSCR